MKVLQQAPRKSKSCPSPSDSVAVAVMDDDPLADLERRAVPWQGFKDQQCHSSFWMLWGLHVGYFSVILHSKTINRIQQAVPHIQFAQTRAHPQVLAHRRLSEQHRGFNTSNYIQLWKWWKLQWIPSKSLNSQAVRGRTMHFALNVILKEDYFQICMLHY